MADDRELMRRVAGGDHGAFAELVRRWDGPIAAFLVKAAGNPEPAADLRQEVFVRAYRYAASYDPQYALSTWLFRIARNVLATWHKKRTRQWALEQDPAWTPERRDPPPDVRERLTEAEDRERLDAALARLEVEDRELILLRFERELSYREMAAVMDAPETTVKSRFYAALARLRRLACGAEDAEERKQVP
ncbi:MAG: sigma-70 family RNA polymerase sigma factor [Candidatus Hydrogenedentes bacterium]|nr:sigma-70 family RNA polymerase sigma factor [Candidatus Hydrogenedentota bacterium]